MKESSTILSTELESAGVLSLLREQCRLFRKLEVLAGKQRAFVNGEVIEPLLNVLADRQKVAARLTEISNALQPVRRLWKEFHDSLDNVRQGEANRLVADSRETLQRLLKSDERDARILSARKQKIGNALSAIGSANRAVSAYRERAQSSGQVDFVIEEME